jgi:transcriptional regulator with XRE-family HTH domain
MDQPANPSPLRGAPSPGDKLRSLRTRLGITAREVEELSRSIAAEQGNDDFIISHGRIIQVENDESTPSIYKLCSLSAIYGVPLHEILSLFVQLDGLSKFRVNLRREETRLVRVELDHFDRPMTFPVRFDPGFDPDRTTLLSRVVQTWGELPVGLVQHLNLRSMQYGLVGLNDNTLFPLLQPGSFVQIDDTQRKVVNAASPTEYARPIYFVETRSGYLCGWCELQKGKLLIIPHPLSPCQVRVFLHPSEAEVVGRVVAVAARIAPLHDTRRPNAPGV